MGTTRKRKFWAAARTGHRAEALAELSAESLGITCYYPQFRAAARRGVRKSLPVFERIVFVRLDPRRGWADLATARGFDGLLRGADGGDVFARPAVVPDHEIDRLKSLENAEGYVVIQGEEPPAFALGDLVAATAGMFRDQTGEYCGLDRENSRRANVAFVLAGCEVISSILRYDLARA